MKRGTEVIFIENNRFREGYVVKNENNKLLIKTRWGLYTENPKKVVRKEKQDEKETNKH